MAPLRLPLHSQSKNDIEDSDNKFKYRYKNPSTKKSDIMPLHSQSKNNIEDSDNKFKYRYKNAQYKKVRHHAFLLHPYYRTVLQCHSQEILILNSAERLHLFKLVFNCKFFQTFLHTTVLSMFIAY